VQADDPLFTLCNVFKTHKITNVTVFNGDRYFGMLMATDISKYYLVESSVARPTYPFLINNFPKLIQGRFIKEGRVRAFEASLALGMMKFERFQSSLAEMHDPLPLVILSDRPRHIELAVKLGVPAIVLIGIDRWEKVSPLFESYEGTVYQSDLASDVTVQLLRVSIPLRHLMKEEQPPIVSPDDYFDDAKAQLVASGFHAFPVLEDDVFRGIMSRRDVMQRPRKKVILMDHNEASQYIDGVGDAEILEIIDHHRFAPEKTALPIFIDCEPVGSTCTLVYRLFRRNDIEIDRETAILLLSGLISDTVILKSPTTTELDREIAHKLAVVGGVPELNAFGQAMFAGGASVTSQDPSKLILTDFKCFNEHGVAFGIGQCEVTTVQGISEAKPKILDCLEHVRVQHNLKWAMLVITNIIQEDSIMLTTAFPAEAKLAYTRQSEGQYFCRNVLSRKVQVLPEVIRALGDDA
jgi:manganese-dependent inorganic pyrophosphatase